MRLLQGAGLAGLAAALAALAACPPPEPEPTQVERGRNLFFNETFAGNGRTCGTCHRAEENFGLSPAFIATLPPTDPLFIAETSPALARNFENPRLMRAFGLILENQDGFDDLDSTFNMRGVPHTLALTTSIASRDGPRTGWSGDGAPGDGSLRAFSTGAVIQHFTKTLNRVPGVDFRLPTSQELDDMEAFMRSTGRQQDLTLPLPLRGAVAARGQLIFLDNTLGKCNNCHVNAGANANPAIFGAGVGNRNFNTGVANLPDKPAKLTGELVPTDDGFGVPGNGEFNTPPLVEAADTPPFFHDNSVATIEGAVAFYNGDAFNNSPSGRLLAGTGARGITLDATQVEAIAAFLRVINALENIRSGLALLEQAAEGSKGRSRENLRLAGEETDDAIVVLAGAGLHPEAIAHLRQARDLIDRSAIERATRALTDARAQLVASR